MLTKAVSGRNMGTLPTGYGKSAVFALQALGVVKNDIHTCIINSDHLNNDKNAVKFFTKERMSG